MEEATDTGVLSGKVEFSETLPCPPSAVGGKQSLGATVSGAFVFPGVLINVKKVISQTIAGCCGLF